MKPMLIAVLLTAATSAAAQELEPRSYSPAPVGTTFVLTGFGRSQGPIVLDPSFDVDNVRGDLWVTTTGLGHVFGLAGRQARILAVVPIASGAVSGNVRGLTQRQPVTGVVDPRVKLSIGLRGAPAQTASEFARASHASPVVGTGVTVIAPWGQYEPTQLVNLGYHRWAFKPEIGASRGLGRWTFDGSAGVWFFTQNRVYYPGNAHRSQNPVVTWQGHVSHPLVRRSWIALDGTWFAGGQTSIDGIDSPDRQLNARLGVTVAIPIAARQSLKFSYSAGATTRRGSAFDTVNITWQIVTF
jgi:hypothetical protein